MPVRCTGNCIYNIMRRTVHVNTHLPRRISARGQGKALGFSGGVLLPVCAASRVHSPLIPRDILFKQLGVHKLS